MITCVVISLMIWFSDAKHMGRDVTNLFIELIEQYKGIAKPDAIKIMAELREKKQFLEDVWT